MVVEMEVIFTVELGKLNETSASCLPSPQLESIAVIPPLSMMPTRGYCFIVSYSSAAISWSPVAVSKGVSNPEKEEREKESLF